MTQIGIIGDPRASDPAHHAITVVPSNTDDLPAASALKASSIPLRGVISVFRAVK